MATGTDDRRARLDRLCDAPVWWAIVAALTLILALPWTQDRLSEQGWPPESFAWRYLSVAAIGAAVGFAELVARYRDEPWSVGRSPPGLAFVGANALAAAIALFLMEYYRDAFSSPADGLTRVLVAGFGAMLVLRSKLLTLRQPGGNEVEVGPAYVVDSLLAAVNRDVDRRRAERRILLVTGMARRFARHRFADAAPHLRASLLAFQSMDAEERRMLNERIRAMMEDGQLRELADEVKFAMVGYDYLTAFGEQAFTCAFEQLAASIPATPPPQGG
jgi:hypothetical protein